MRNCYGKRRASSVNAIRRFRQLLCMVTHPCQPSRRPSRGRSSRSSNCSSTIRLANAPRRLSQGIRTASKSSMPSSSANAYRKHSAANANVNFIELKEWCKDWGIIFGTCKPAVAELKHYLIPQNFERQQVASKAGILLVPSGFHRQPNDRQPAHDAGRSCTSSWLDYCPCLCRRGHQWIEGT